MMMQDFVSEKDLLVHEKFEFGWIHGFIFKPVIKPRKDF